MTNGSHAIQGDLFQTPAVDSKREGDLKPWDFLSRVKLTLRLDQIVMGVIGWLVLFAVVFALGVEQGKRPQAVTFPTVLPAVEEVAPTPVLTSGEEVSPDPPPSPVSAFPAGSYTIQTVTYKYMSAADRQMKKLERMGHHAFVIPSGDLLQVCVDGFESRQQASKTLRLLKVQGVIAQDAFVRPIPQ